MINIQKQIDYCVNGAEDDLITADLLLKENRVLHGLFFCHLVIEKAIKAHYVKENEEIAPHSHNLIYLSESAKLDLEEDIQFFLGLLMKYQLQGRYPDYNPVLPDPIKVNEYMIKTKDLFRWLKKKL